MKVGDNVIVERKYDSINELKGVAYTNYWIELEGQVVAVADGYVKVQGTKRVLGIPYTVKEWFKLDNKDYKVIPFSD